MDDLEARILALESAYVGWVYQPRIEAIFGMTAGQVKARIDRGQWIRGEHWAIVEGRRMFHVEAIQAWHTRKASGRGQVVTFRSTSSTGGGPTTGLSGSRPRRLV